MNTVTKQGVNRLREQVLEKAFIAIQILDNPTLFLPIGTEWNNPDFSHGLQIRELCGIRENVETTSIKCDGAKGTRVDPHYHDNKERIVVVDGHVRLTLLPGETIDLRATDTYIIPAGVIHSLEFMEDSLFVAIWHPRFSLPN